MTSIIYILQSRVCTSVSLSVAPEWKGRNPQTHIHFELVSPKAHLKLKKNPNSIPLSWESAVARYGPLSLCSCTPEGEARRGRQDAAQSTPGESCSATRQQTLVGDDRRRVGNEKGKGEDQGWHWGTWSWKTEREHAVEWNPPYWEKNGQCGPPTMLVTGWT